MDDGQPMFAVIVPARNSEGTLRRTVDSILAQTLGGLELIIVENGSSDGTAALAQELEHENDRVRTVLDGPRGAGPARNAGADIAESEWLCFLDADDTMDPGFLNRMKRLTEEQPGHALYACNGRISYRRFDAAVTSGIRHMFPHALDAPTAAWMSILPGQVVLRADIVRELGGFEDRRGEETDLWLRVLLKHSGYWIPDKLYRNYQDPAGISRQPDARAMVGKSLGDSITSHLEEVHDEHSRRPLEKRARRWYSYAKASSRREELEDRMASGNYHHARAEYLRLSDAYQTRWRFWLGLPLMMLSPRLFARYTGAGYTRPASER